MKIGSKFVTRVLLATAFCAALSLTAVRADDDNEQGGDIDGSETLDVDLAMTPTSAAPAGSSIELSLEADDEDGATQAKLKLEAQALPPGTYSVNVTLKSDGSTVALGTFTVDSSGETEVEFTNEAESENGDESGDDEGGDENGDGNATAPFPANFNPLDIATVSVSDASGTVLFTADLTNATGSGTMQLNASVQATPGAAASNATGTASLVAAVSHRKAKGSLQFNGQALPTKMAVTLAVNGVAAKNLKTDNRGAVSVKLGPKGNAGTVAPGVSLMNVHSATLLDKSGNTLLQANF